jgi:MFS family permease
MPFFWTLAQTPWQVSMVQIYGNLAWSGFHVASTPLLLAICPPERRARYFAIFNTINGLATVLGPIPGTWAYTTWGFTAIGIMSALGRGAGGLLFLLFLSTGWLKDVPGSRRRRGLTAEDAENTAGGGEKGENGTR